MKVLVTGATGFLGSHLCRELGRSGFQVAALRRSTSNSEPLMGLDLEFVTADLTDADSLARAVEGCDAVIHAAADIRYASRDRELQYRINVEGSATLARVCREHGVKRLVHVSSVAAIGIPPRGTIADENFPFNLERSRLYYHLTKKRAEEAVLRNRANGFDVVIVNPGSVFGPHGRIYRGGDMVYKAGRGALAAYFLGGICAVHVDDVAAGTIAALTHGRSGERYILGAENLTYKEIVTRAVAALGLKRRSVPVLPAVTAAAVLLRRLPYITHYTASRHQFYSSAKAQQMLAYRPRPFATILQECIEFPETIGARRSANCQVADTP